MDRARIDAMLRAGASIQLHDGRSVRVRPVLPTDADAVQAFVRDLSDASRRLRFFSSVRELSPAMLRRLTDVTAERDRVLIALADEDGVERVVALAQYAAAEGGNACDLAFVNADDWQGLGLGRLLMDMLLESARDAGFARADADVLRGNDGMLGLARAFGFSVAHSPLDATMLRITRYLRDAPEAVRVQRPARSRSPANSSLQNPPPWKRSATGSGASLACAASAASR